MQIWTKNEYGKWCKRKIKTLSTIGRIGLCKYLEMREGAAKHFNTRWIVFSSYEVMQLTMAGELAFGYEKNVNDNAKKMLQCVIDTQRHMTVVTLTTKGNVKKFKAPKSAHSKSPAIVNHIERTYLAIRIQ